MVSPFLTAMLPPAPKLSEPPLFTSGQPEGVRASSIRQTDDVEYRVDVNRSTQPIGRQPDLVGNCWGDDAVFSVLRNPAN